MRSIFGDGRLHDISFELHPGEIVGLAGLGGSGRSRLMRMLYGAAPHTSGRITVGGVPYRPRDPHVALSLGVGLITEDRNYDGFIDTLPVWQNVTLPWTSRFRRNGFIRLDLERGEAARSINLLGVRTPSINALMTQLSGGNQQKAIFARWTMRPMRILMLDEPTHGVDIGAKANIYEIIRDLAKQGVSMLVASSELEELQALCDRVLILRNGTIEAEMPAGGVTKNAILHRLLASDCQHGGRRDE